MKTVREMLVSLTTKLINPLWASIIGIYVEKVVYLMSGKS